MRKLIQGIFPTSIKFLMLPITMRLFLRHRIGCRLMGYEFFGLNGLDKQLIEVIGNKPGYFVEIGANDGFAASNTKHLELFHGWKGILIDQFLNKQEGVTLTGEIQQKSSNRLA